MNAPSSFVALHAAGHFDYWGGARPGDAAERQRRYAERRPRVLWLRAIEWEVTPEEIVESSELRPGLYRFAGDGVGGSYVFCPAWQRGAAEPPVVYVPHDEPRASLYAPNLPIALFRLWLEHGADWDNANDGPDREGMLRAWGAIIEPHLEGPYRERIAQLAADPSPAAFKAARDALRADVPSETMIAELPPTRYNPKFVKGERAKKLYEESIAFYESLVAEGHARFATQLAEARANRDAALKP